MTVSRSNQVLSFESKYIELLEVFEFLLNGLSTAAPSIESDCRQFSTVTRPFAEVSALEAVK